MKLFFFYCLTILFVNQMNAQDPTFSQLLAAPSLTNPAINGLYGGQTRVSALFRQQSPQVGFAYTTGILSVDYKPGYEDGINSTNDLTIGGSLLYDKTPEGILKTTAFNATISYKIDLDDQGKQKLAMGFMGGYGQRKLDLTQLNYLSQFGSGGFNSAIAASESFKATSTSNFDVHTGLAYIFENEFTSFSAGVGYYHITQPNNYFLSSGEGDLSVTIPSKFSFHAALNTTTESTYYKLSANYMMQKGATMAVLGGEVGLPFEEDNGIFYAGLYSRLGQSVYPVLELQYNNLTFGLSYDIATTQQPYYRQRRLN